MVAYEREYDSVPENVHNNYHRIYGELAFFIDDALFARYENSLSIAVKCYSDKLREVGTESSEHFCRGMIADKTITVPGQGDADTILTRLKEIVPTCPSLDRLILTYALAYCAATHEAMWNEWAAFANLIRYKVDWGSQ